MKEVEGGEIMTWLMFDNKLMCAETGVFFQVVHDLGGYPLIYCDNRFPIQQQSFKTESEAKARFEELKKMLLTKSKYVDQYGCDITNPLKGEG